MTVTHVTDEAGTEHVRLEGYAAGVSFRVTGRPAGAGLLVDSYSVSISRGRGGSMSSGHCLHGIRYAGQTLAADAQIYPDRSSCDAALASGATSSLGPCVGSALSRMRNSAPGSKPAAKSDPLLRRMRARATVWVLEGDRCLSWRFVPNRQDPSKGSIERMWKEADGTRVKHGYGYKYSYRLLGLTGPGGEETRSDHSRRVYGMGCFEELWVDHQKGASKVGGQLWHYTKAGCNAERRAVQIEGDKSAPKPEDEVARGNLGGC